MTETYVETAKEKEFGMTGIPYFLIKIKGHTCSHSIFII